MLRPFQWMRAITCSLSLFWQIFCNEPVVKRRESRQSEIPCCSRQHTFTIAYRQLTSFTEYLACFALGGWDFSQAKSARISERLNEKRESAIACFVPS